MKAIGESLAGWWPVILILGQLVLGWMQWKLSRRFVTKEELEKVAHAMKGHDTRIGNVEGQVLLLEQELKHMPTSDDLCRLKESIAVFGQTAQSLQRAVTRIENYLMENSKK